MKNPEYFLRYDFQKYEIFQDSSILPAIVSCPLFRSATRSIPSAPALAPANEISHQVDYLKNRSISDWLLHLFWAYRPSDNFQKDCYNQDPSFHLYQDMNRSTDF